MQQHHRHERRAMRHLLNVLGLYLHGRMQTPDRMQRLRIHTQAK